MALSLAACGGSSTTVTTPVVDTPVVDTPVVVTPASESFTLTSAANAFTGGDGADSFTAATAAVIQCFDTLDGGAGTDTLTITDVADAYEGATGVGGTISNVEVLTVNSSGGFGTAAADASGAVAATAGVEQIAKLTVSAPADGTAVTVTINGVTYATSITSASSNTATEAADAIEAVVDAVLGGDYYTNVAGAVTITSPYEGSALPTITASNTVVASTGNVANVDTVLDAGAAAQVLQWTLGGTGDASSTVTLHVDGVNIGAFVFDTTAGASKREAAATKIATELNRHLAGAVVITTANAATTAYGGAGNDEFIVTATTGSTYVKIMDLAVGDKIDFGSATAFGTAAVDVSSQTTLAGAIGAADGTDDKVSYFDFGGDTYIVLAGSSTSAITDDTVIQLVGDYDLSTATLSSNEITIA